MFGGLFLGAYALPPTAKAGGLLRCYRCEASDYEAVDDGTYDLEVRPTGADEIVLALDDTSFDGGTAYTAIAIGQVSDGSLDAILAEDATLRLPADD